jgi:hypothetical protein
MLKYLIIKEDEFDEFFYSDKIMFNIVERNNFCNIITVKIMEIHYGNIQKMIDEFDVIIWLTNNPFNFINLKNKIIVNTSVNRNLFENELSCKILTIDTDGSCYRLTESINKKDIIWNMDYFNDFNVIISWLILRCNFLSCLTYAENIKIDKTKNIPDFKFINSDNEFIKFCKTNKISYSGIRGDSKWLFLFNKNKHIQCCIDGNIIKYIGEIGPFFKSFLFLKMFETFTRVKYAFLLKDKYIKNKLFINKIYTDNCIQEVNEVINNMSKGLNSHYEINLIGLGCFIFFEYEQFVNNEFKTFDIYDIPDKEIIRF